MAATLAADKNHRDVFSNAARRRHGFQVKSLQDLPYESSRWVEEAVPEDRRSTPADLAAIRMDFKSWLGTLTASQHRIARALASGETTKTTAEMLGLTPGRISQVRSELEESWSSFQAQALGR